MTLQCTICEALRKCPPPLPFLLANDKISDDNAQKTINLVTRACDPPVLRGGGNLSEKTI